MKTTVEYKFGIDQHIMTDLGIEGVITSLMTEKSAENGTYNKYYVRTIYTETWFAEHELSPMLGSITIRDKKYPLPRLDAEEFADKTVSYELSEAQKTEYALKRDLAHYKEFLGFAVSEYGTDGALEVGVTKMSEGYSRDFTFDHCEMENGSAGVRITSKVIKDETREE